jgi:arylsulfatase A-like enzyme
LKTDGLSLVSFLQGGPAPKRDYFYWELHEGQSLQAARWGDWKAVRNGPAAKIEVYDLKNDFAEQHDLAATRPELVEKALAIFKDAHLADPNWPMRSQSAAKKAKKGK